MEFYLEQKPNVQEKIEFVFRIIRQVERVSKKFLDHMEGSDGLYEIRIEVGSNIFRIFCCFDEGKVDEQSLHSPRVRFQDSCIEVNEPQSGGDCPVVERESPGIQGGISTNCYADPPHVPTCYWRRAILLHGHEHPPTNTMGVENLRAAWEACPPSSWET